MVLTSRSARVLLVLTVAPLLLLVPSVTADANGYGVDLVCPDASAADPTAPVRHTGCPIRIFDRPNPTGDDLLGQPVLVADPDEPSQILFASLHGAYAEEGPSERSRENEPHTVWSTLDGGREWYDNPFQPAVQDIESYGEAITATADADGRIHLAALYAHRGEESARFRYTFAAWRFPGVGEFDSDLAVDYDRPDLLRVAGAHHVGTPGTVAIPGDGNSTRNGTVALTWHQHREDEPGRLGLATWSDGGGFGRVALHGAPAACVHVSNPATDGRLLYVACQNGTISLHGIEPTTGVVVENHTTPLADGRPRLAVSPEGRVVVSTAGEEDGRPWAHVAFGHLDGGWDALRPVGSAVAGPVRVEEARIQTVALRPASGAAHLIYMERRPAPPLPSPGRPAYRKVLAAVHPVHGVVDTTELHVGNSSRSYGPGATGQRRGAFNDLHDSLIVVRNGSRVREFLAFGDYGLVGFAEVLERPGELRPPAAPPPPTPAPPVPGPAGAAAGAASPHPLVVGLVGGALALGMTARLLLVHRARAVGSPVGEEGP